MFESIEQLIESLSNMYDIESLEFDYKNNNVPLDNPEIERYFIPNIIATSVLNGQFKQASNQVKQFNLSGDDLSDLISADDLARILTV